MVVSKGGGKTEYVFVAPVVTATTTDYAATLTHSPTSEEGWSWVATGPSACGSDVLWTSTARTAAVAVGACRQRVCARCHVVSTSKVVNRADCPSLCYCSARCLGRAAPLLDACGPAVQRVRDEWVAGSSSSSSSSSSSNNSSSEAAPYADTAVLLLVLLHQHCGQAQDDDPSPRLQRARRGTLPNAITDLLRLETHAATAAHTSTSPPGLAAAAALLRPLLAPLLARWGLAERCALSDKHGGEGDVVATLLRALRFNAQLLPVPGLPGTSILTACPVLARCNHSCRPTVTVR